MSSAFNLCSRAWSGRKGFVFLSVRDVKKGKDEPGYWRDIPFSWPDDTRLIKSTLRKAVDSKKDVYFSPHVYSDKRRSRDLVTNAKMLFADLDEVNPKDLPAHLKPTAAWRTSPGRWQAMWEMDHLLHPTTQQNLNKRLTYAIGADRGGYDLTQVLRIPGTHNHKYEDKPEVELLWLNGHKIDPIKLIDDLPEVEMAEVDRTEVEKIPDQSFVIRNHKLPSRASTLIKARNAKIGTRSEVLWELECLLAEAGLSVDEIVGVVRPTVWNKFKDRQDEIRQLSSEARKAIAHRKSVTTNEKGDEKRETLEEAEDEPEISPLSWKEFDEDHKAIRWMVADIWGEGEVGFISGQPKSYKSWIAIDLAVSVATGTRFLGTFQCRKHNVLLIQEEDPKPVMQERLAVIAATKGLLGTEDNGDGTFDMWYDLPENLFVISNQGFTINEEWLEQLENWITDKDIRLVILDPLMMMGEDFDEFKAFEVMAKVLKPLKQLRSRTQAAIAVVHHHNKNATDSGAKGMYGSVALWAWEEAALHLSIVGVGRVLAERFSKHSLLTPVTIEVGDIDKGWRPHVGKLGSTDLYDVLATMEDGATVEDLMTHTAMGREAVDRQLKQLEKDEKIEKAGSRRSGPGRPRTVWRLTP